MTTDRWLEVNRHLVPCLETRKAHWLRSFVSLESGRSVCELEVPYAEAVREACRAARMPFNRVWRAEIWSAQHPNGLIACHHPILAEFTYEPPITHDGYELVKKKAKPCLLEAGVQPLFTLMSLNREQSICLFEATSAEDVRLAFRKSDLPFRRVWRSQLILPLGQ